MIPSRDQQEHLADFAPAASLDKYSKGADPRVISGIVALSEMQQQAALRQHAAMANGAAPGQMPTVRDKIMQMFRQSNPAQPQVQPNPMRQGIMAQANPQMQTAPMPEKYAPEEAQMYHGGVARLPVGDGMFGYAGGGIIAFKKGDEVPRPVGEEAPLDPEERTRLERELLMRVIGAEETARNTPPETPPAAPVRRPAVQMGAADQDLGAAITSAAQAEREPEVVRAIKTPFRAIGEGIKSLYRSAPGTEPTPVGAADQDLAAAITNVDRTAPTRAAAPAPTRTPAEAAEQVRLAQLHDDFVKTSGIAGGQKRVGGFTLSETIEKARENLEAEGKKLTPDDVRIIQRRFEGAAADKGTGIKAAPPAAVPGPAAAPGPAAPPQRATIPGGPPAAGTPPGTDLAKLLSRRIEQQTAPAAAAAPAKEDTVDNTLKLLEAQDKYVRNQPNSPAADALLRHYDEARKRALADDNAQAAQRAADDRNNLWTFLTNTRGSSLGVAAGKANAAIQPLLSEQKKANAEYRRYSYERDLNLNKASAELQMAEEERKRGRFDKALDHEEKARTYRLDAKKADEQARHNKETELNQTMQTAATLQAHREGNLTQLEVARINRAAQMAGFNKPTEAERVYEKYISIRDSKGQKAADEYLNDQDKVRASVGGVKHEGQDKSVANRAKVYEILNKNESYTTAQETIRRLEAKAKRTPQEEQRLAQARKYTQDTFNNTYKGIYGTGPDADTGSSGGFPVTAPDGKTYNFKTQAEADAFRAKIGG